MSKLSISKSKLPRAIAKEKDGITLYWVDELNLSGLHMQGMAALLECNVGTIQNALKGCKQITLLEAEILTEGGFQGVSILKESDIAVILRYITRSKAKIETRDRADDIRDRLVVAGFKLAVMLELAPEKLVPKIAAKSIPNYLPARTKCMDLLKEHGAKSYAYGMVEKYNNELNGIGKGSRHSVTQEEAIGLVMNYQSATIELLERKRGFSTHEAHLANTAKKAMRHEKYIQFGEGSVPENLKPRKEQKLIG